MKIYKKYLNFLKNEVSVYEADLKEKIEFAQEYADENLSPSRGADYDLMVESAQEETEQSLRFLCGKALDRGCDPEDLYEIFGESVVDYCL